MRTINLKSALALFPEDKKKNTLVLDKWPIKESNILNELAAIGIVEIKFNRGKITVNLLLRGVLEIAVKEKAKSIIKFDNSTDRNACERIKKYPVDRKHLIREVYVIKKTVKKEDKYNVILVHPQQPANCRLALPFYVDNVCIISYYTNWVEDTVFGLKFHIGDKFCFMTTPDKHLARDLYDLTKVTTPGYNQWHVYNFRSNKPDDSIYQMFAGWAETWLLGRKRIWLTDNLFYSQEITSSSDMGYWDEGIKAPAPLYQFFTYNEHWGYQEVGYAYDHPNAKHNMEHPCNLYGDVVDVAMRIHKSKTEKGEKSVSDERIEKMARW